MVSIRDQDSPYRRRDLPQTPLTTGEDTRGLTALDIPPAYVYFDRRRTRPRAQYQMSQTLICSIIGHFYQPFTAALTTSSSPTAAGTPLSTEIAMRLPVRHILVIALAITSAVVIMACSNETARIPAPALNPATPTPTKPPTPTAVLYHAAVDVNLPEPPFEPDVQEKYDLGLKLSFQGEHRQAITAFTEAQSLHGQPSAAISNNIATEYHLLGNQKLAIHHYSASLAIADNSGIRSTRAAAYLLDDQCQLAIRDANRSLEMPPTSAPAYDSRAEAHTTLAHCYARRGDSKEAIVSARHAVNIMQLAGYPEPLIKPWQQQARRWEQHFRHNRLQ